MSSESPEPSLSEGRRFSLGQRLSLSLITWTGWILIWLICSTLRLRQEGEAPFKAARERREPLVLAFWHNQIFAATYAFRFQGAAVLASLNFDGEYIARITKLFGFEAVRGSSSRGSLGALMQLRRILRRGGLVGITADGPRGPRYRAKPGPVFLARQAGATLMPFHLEVSRYWELSSWDRFRIPVPFSEAVLKFGKPIPCEAAGDEDRPRRQLQEEMERLQKELEQRRAKPREDL